MNDLEFLYSIWINSTPEKIWEAFTSPEFTEKYWHKARVESTWEVGAKIDFWVEEENGNKASGCTGEIIECEFPKKLSYTWAFPLNPELKHEAPSTVSFEIIKKGDMSKLTIRHYNFPDGSKIHGYVSEGWPLVICGMKTLIETGKSFDYSAEWEKQ